MQANDIDRARDALNSIPADLSRDEWHRVGRAGIATGLSIDGIVVELDAAPVKLLQSKLREAIRSVIDIPEYNAQIELEESDASNVEAHRRVVFAAIGWPA